MLIVPSWRRVLYRLLSGSWERQVRGHRDWLAYERRRVFFSDKAPGLIMFETMIIILTSLAISIPSCRKSRIHCLGDGGMDDGR